MSTPFYFNNLDMQDERSYFLQVHPDRGCLIAVLLLASLLWGSYMKCLTYSYLQRVKIIERPVNLIILVSQVVHHLLHIFLDANILIELLFNMSPLEFAKTYLNLHLNESSYCSQLYFLAAFNTFYLTVGNSVLAMYRLIYLTMTNMARKMMGEKGELRMIIVAIFTGISTSGIMSWFFVSEKSSTRAVFNFCVGRSQKFQEMIIDYQREEKSETPFLMTALFGLSMLFMSVEFACYIAVYSYLYAHDTLMLKQAVISSDLYKNRQKHNIISVAGQFYCFLAEVIFIMTLTFWINLVENYDVVIFKEIYFVFKLTEFGISSTIQVIASRELRHMFFSSIYNCITIFLRNDHDN